MEMPSCLSMRAKPGYDGGQSCSESGDFHERFHHERQRRQLRSRRAREWCGPCKMIAPVLDEISQSYQGKLKVCKLNIDENPDTPPKYGVRGIPTLMLFKDGNVEATKVGALSKSQLTAFLDSNI
jgi:thioredoxin 1